MSRRIFSTSRPVVATTAGSSRWRESGFARDANNRRIARPVAELPAGWNGEPASRPMGGLRTVPETTRSFRPVDRSEARASTSNLPFDDPLPHRSLPARGVATRLTPRPFEQDVLAKRDSVHVLSRLRRGIPKPKRIRFVSLASADRLGAALHDRDFLRDQFGRTEERRWRPEQVVPIPPRRLTGHHRRRGGSVRSVPEGPPNRRFRIESNGWHSPGLDMQGGAPRSQR